MNKVFAALSFSVLSPVLLAKPVIVTSIKPVSMVVAAVGGDKIEIEQIVSNNASPHDFAMRPSDLKKIEDADTVVWVGEALEGFLEKPLENAEKEDASIEWLALEGVQLQEFAHKHEHEHEDEHEDHDEDYAEEEHHHHHDGVNPHLWLSPGNAKVLAEAVAQRLEELDSTNAAYYKENLASFETKLAVEDQSIQSKLASVKTVPYIVFHDGYGYFEKHYGLNHAGAITVSPERKPGAKKVAEIRHEIEEHQVQCVFSEPQFKPAIVKTLLEGTNVKTASLDPLGSTIPLSQDSYLTFLNTLGDQFLTCLR